MKWTNERPPALLQWPQFKFTDYHKAMVLGIFDPFLKAKFFQIKS